MTGSTQMPHAARTDVGRRREHNEDALLSEPPVLAVADGVGGSAKGEVASRTALDTFATGAAEATRAGSSQEAARAMEHAVLAANSAVHEAQLRDETLRGMATTITAAVVRDGGEVVVGHVGDSRLYVLSAAGARQVTEDHSVVAELVRSGRIDAADAAHHPQRNVITRALGPEADVSVDAFVMHVGPGDWLLACSDGLTEHVGDEELAQAVLAEASDPAAAVDALVDLANERGGTDNISVVLAQPVPSDVSGELTMEALQAAAGATTQLPARPWSDAPAEASGPLAQVHDDAMPPLQPIGHQDESLRQQRPIHRGPGRGWAIVALVAALAAVGGAFVWSQSYFLVEREDGRIGIDRGFPIGRLATPYRSSDVMADELGPADRERLVESHRILGREDAERVLEQLPHRIDGSLDEQDAQRDGEAPDGDAASA